MSRKYTPMTVYSIRLSPDAVIAIQQRACEQKLPAAMLIRSIINSYLSDQDVNDYLAAIEERIIATLQRLSQHQLDTQMAVNTCIAQNEFLRRRFDTSFAKRQPDEDTKHLLLRYQNAFMAWLPKAMAKDGVVNRILHIDQPSEETMYVKPSPMTGKGENTSDVF